ncbi:MAG: BrnA antitoxin family protein [Pseudomonadota bacterium]
MKKEPQYIEYENGKKVLLDDDDAPEMSEEWFQNAKHGLDGLAELVGEEFVAPLRLRGRPKKKDKKVSLHLRIDKEIADKFRATGKGWQTRLNTVLHNAIDQGML